MFLLNPVSKLVLFGERNSPVQTPRAGLPSKTASQPVIDASVLTMWRWWIAPILTPLWRKMGSCHIKRVRKQLRDTLIRRVAGPLERILNSLIYQRNSLRWSNPRGSTGEAGAMRPRSLQQVLTETWWPSLKQAKHALKLEIRAWARWLAFERNANEPSKTQFVEKGREHSCLRPRARIWQRTISLWQLTNSLE